MRNVKYDFSSVHVDVPTTLANQIVEWGKRHIPNEILFRDLKRNALGREDELHITILYGIHSKHPSHIFQLLQDEKMVPITLGEIHIFKGIEWFDVVTISVAGDDLERLNAKLRSNVKHSTKHRVYVPHITVAYVDKNKMDHLKGNEIFANKKFWAKQAVFSSKDGKRWSIKLKA